MSNVCSGADHIRFRNQHIIKSSIPTSHDYPGKSLDTKFVLQHECMCNEVLSLLYTNFNVPTIGTGTMDLIPFLSVTPGTGIVSGSTFSRVC